MTIGLLPIRQLLDQLAFISQINEIIDGRAVSGFAYPSSPIIYVDMYGGIGLVLERK